MVESTQFIGSVKHEWMSVFHTDAGELTPKEIAAMGYHDPVFYCKYFLDEMFSEPMPWIHRAVLAVLTGRCKFLEKYGELNKITTNFEFEENGDKLQLFYFDDEGILNMRKRKYTNLMLPRGCSKTTIAGIAVPTYEINYQDSPFTVYVSEAGPHAKMQLDSIKNELSFNEKFHAVFGNLRPKQSSDERWSQDMFETTNGIAVAARGAGSQVRGILHHGRRPGKIIVDDVDDKDSVRTEERRKNRREWFYADVIPALPKVLKTGTICNLATTLHPEALASALRRDPQWTNIVFGARDKQEELLWPIWMNEEDLAREKTSYQMQGLLHVYYMEYFNQIVAPETQIFKQEYLQYGLPKGTIRTAIYVDPAISERRTADRTFIIVCGMSSEGFIYVLDVWAKRGASPRELIDKYFEMAIRFDCDRVTGHGVEAVAYQAALVHLMREEMFRKGHYFEITAVTHARKNANIPSKKEERIQAILQPRYAAKYIYHVQVFPDLETELLDFTLANRGKDDGPDCLAGCVSLLDPFAADASGLIDLAQDQYESLDDLEYEEEKDRYGELTNAEGYPGSNNEFGRWAN